ncbi:hypothetical protein AX16_002218 [Volvariella volvacea WC 439]|nr:hypothetical protein AX16_002218 [Volvariella volvacea WC 439]
MFLASLFLAAFARSLASPVPIVVPGASISSPVCIVAATITASRCDPTRTRTIFDILYSCIGVILLCTYISIHHNIPDQDDSRAKVMWKKVRTTLYALVAPEMVIMWAIRQWMMAGEIAKENKDRGWTRTHGFFVQMGGLMQRVEVEGEVSYRVAGVTTRENRFVDWSSMKIPHIPKKEIEDHGKGDFLAKAIVVLQTTWFVAQCVARNVQGLVLTELELVTLAFATLNVVTYVLWWDKPLNIGYPIYFDEDGNRVDGPSALVDTLGKGADSKEGSDNGSESGDGSEGEVRGVWYKRIWVCIMAGCAQACQSIWESMKDGWRESKEKYGMATVIVAPFLAVFGPLWNMIMEEGESNKTTSVDPFYAAYLDDSERYLAIVYGSLIGVVFGAIHLIGWNFRFPTTTELWLWRGSSLVLTVIPLNFLIGYAVDILYKRLEFEALNYIGGVILYPTVFLGPLFYFAARIILLFIAFATLRSLPDSAYQNVRWTEYLPHI